MASTVERRIFADAEELAAAGVELFVTLAEQAIAARGRFTVALSGGSTPKRMLSLLAGDAERVEWSKVQFFWSDERCVPPDDEQSNYHMARESLLDRIPLTPEQVHRMPADSTPLIAAADSYAAELRHVLGVNRTRTPRLDLIMLGMGPDGHTASLFPETAVLDDRHRLVAANFVPKLAAQRLTFTPRLINAAADVLFLVGGADKAEALQAVLEGPSEPRRYPAQLIQPADGALHWYIDQAAASALAAE